MKRILGSVVLLFLLASCGSASTNSSTATVTESRSPTQEPSSGLTPAESTFKRDALKLLSSIRKGNHEILAMLTSSSPDDKRLASLVVDASALNSSWRTPTSPSQRMTSLFGMYQQCATSWEGVCTAVGNAVGSGDEVSKLSRRILKARAVLAEAQAVLGVAEWNAPQTAAKARAQVAELRKNGALDELDLNTALDMQGAFGALNDALDAINTELANVIALANQ
jgi:hypothetical protein